MRFQVSFDRRVAALRVVHGVLNDRPEPEGSRPRLAGVRERMQRETEEHVAIQQLASGLQQAVVGVEAMVQENLRAVSDLATELGLAIAQQIVGSVVLEGLFDPSEIVDRCLRDLVQGGQGVDLSVELSPEDLNPVFSHFEADAELKEQVGRVDFVANPELDRGALRVSSRSGCLLYDPLEVLQRMCDEVRKGVGP